MSDAALSGLSHLADAETRAISPENFTGEKGGGGMATEGTGASAAGDLGQGWKVSPSVDVAAGETFVLADIEGSGVIRHFWITTLSGVPLRDLILRIHWDNQVQPSVEAPLGDFFCQGWERFAQVSSLAVCVNPGRSYNCYWEMPFRSRARLTLENRGDRETTAYYQITYTEEDVSDACACFHAQFRRENTVEPGRDYVMMDGIAGRGHYVGAYVAWRATSEGWWGEGEIKFFLDGDDAFPTICGTGIEDYFGGSHNFDIGTADPDRPKAYTAYTTPYTGLPQIIPSDRCYRPGQRFGMYRWHIPDPIRFRRALKVTIQALGWDDGDPRNRRYRLLRDDIASVAFWYQTLPTAPFPPLPGREALLADSRVDHADGGALTPET